LSTNRFVVIAGDVIVVPTLAAPDNVQSTTTDPDGTL
jgi:hypothetical protein